MDSVRVRTPIYTEEDHHTWAELCRRQSVLVAPVACRLFEVGWPKLNLDQTHLPNPVEVSSRIFEATGWTLTDAQNGYLGPTEWFEHLAERRFPVTNYIRRPDEIAFTPNPDLFHEYFGHLAFFMDQDFADTAELFGKLYLNSGDERQRLAIARLWWYTTEFGFIREGGSLKLYGAGLLSSPGELLHSLKPETPRVPFVIPEVIETPGAAYSMHTKYFILEDEGHVRRILKDFAAMEGILFPSL